jgi:hypothetical protein
MNCQAVPSLQGMQPNHVALGISNQRDKSVLAYCKFWLDDGSTAFNCALGLYGTV